VHKRIIGVENRRTRVWQTFDQSALNLCCPFKAAEDFTVVATNRGNNADLGCKAPQGRLQLHATKFLNAKLCRGVNRQHRLQCPAVTILVDADAAFPH
jgi:hypothetical protein